LRRLESYDQLLALDPIGYYAVAIPADEVVASWDLGGAVAVLMRAEFGTSLVCQGDADAVSHAWPDLLAVANLVGGERTARATVPAASVGVVPFTTSHGWNWMMTSVSPPLQARESDVQLLNDDDAINAFLAEANPDASTRPGDPEIVEWAVVPDPNDSGRLLASAAVTQWRSGALVLVSVATRPDARGQGLAAAVSAFLTRRVIDTGRGPMVLGYYAENDTAERVYQRLGFGTRSRNVSGWLIDRPPMH
jgi:GNAT superfamily N-acetyltransferase